MGKAISKVLGIDSAPTPEEVKVAPDPDDQEAARIDQRKRQRASNTGRVSTVLSDSSKLG